MPEWTPSRRAGRWLVGLLLVALAAGLALHLAARSLRSVVVDALGPQAELQRVELLWNGVRLHGLKLRARDGWPSKEEASAERIDIVPALRSLWPGQPWQLHSVDVHSARLTVLRQRDGKAQLLPSLLMGAAKQPSQARDNGPAMLSAGRAGQSAASTKGQAGRSPRLQIATIRWHDSAIDYLDASIARPAHRLQLLQVKGQLRGLQLPLAGQRVEIEIAAQLAGRAANAAAGTASEPTDGGTLTLRGHTSLPLRDGDLRLVLRGVNMRLLEPYLLGQKGGGLERGSLDLDLNAAIQSGQLNAPGRVVMKGLRFAEVGGLHSLAGVPRGLVLAAMERHGRIVLDFTLEGRIDDPDFSLNANLAARFAVGLAQALGVSVKDVVQGLGGVVRGLLGR
jgi:hypothetical protein